MVEKLSRQSIAEKAIIHAAPVTLLVAPSIARARHEVDRTFGLPPGLYGATIALFLGFLAVMAIGFGNPEMALPMVIFATVIIAGFGVPALWARMQPAKRAHALNWARFESEGIGTGSGHSSARAATVQVLILPVLIFAWGLATVTIAALVR